MHIKTLFFTCLLISQGVQAVEVSDSLAMSCNKTVEVNEITKTVVRMTPFRGVNLIFPEKLFDSATVYSLSSDKVWSFVRASGTNIVPITFKTMQNVFGEIQDFTIATEDHIYTVALVAEPDITKHCNNIVFKYSDKEKQRLEDKKKEAARLALARLNVSQKANQGLSSEVGSLRLATKALLSTVSENRIYEEKQLQFEEGAFVVYVDKLKSFDGIDILIIELENQSSKVITLNGSSVYDTSSGHDVKISGVFTDLKSLKSEQSSYYHFTTTEPLADIKRKLVINTNIGEVAIDF